jgi:hypothetical protein
MTRGIIFLMGSRGKGEKGQVAILFALVFTFMFVIFAFVIDFGHLINTKINLQIAADTAAYAGAAWQARQLNRISMVNYHMRQDVKEMAMRAQVTHIRHNRNFPHGSQFYNGGNAPPRGLFPFMCQQAHGYVSISGVKYDPATNLCKNASPETGGLPPIVVPPVIASFDPFAVAISKYIGELQKASDRECRAAATDNRALAQHFINVFSRRSQYHLRQIQELQNWMNEVASENESSNHPIVRAAVESARRNLSLAANDEFKLEILQPATRRYLELQPMRMRGTMFYYDFSTQGSGCVGIPSFLDYNDMIAGVTKSQEILTYFAVKLTAKPKMLFMPARWVEDGFPELTAIAAAKPFGSRLGPDITADPLVPIPNRPGNNNPQINFSFRPNDGLGMINQKMMAFFDAIHPFNGKGNPDGNQGTGWPDANKSDDLRFPLQAIRSPTIFDALFYSVFPDPNDGEGNLERFAEVLYPDYLEASGPNNELINLPNPITAAYLPSGVGSRNRGAGWVQINADPTGVADSYSGYSEESPSSHSVLLASRLPIVGGKEREFGFANRELVHSAWAPQGSPGRIGYSVKFVGMDALVRTIQIRSPSGGATNISNPPQGYPSEWQIYH